MNFLKRRFLQMLLFLVAILSWNELLKWANGWMRNDIQRNYIETAYEGGTISMGLITSICIFCIVWIEISHKK